ncbi:MAG: AI-2E family transporter [Thermomicrobiales bacterium]
MSSESSKTTPRGRWPAEPLVIQISARTILLIIALVAGVYLLFRIPRFWLIVLAAVVLATALDKPVAAMQARGVPRALGILLIYVVLIVFLVGAIAALGPVIAGDIRALSRELPGYVSQIEQAIGRVSPNAPDRISFSGMEQTLQSHASTVAGRLTAFGIELGQAGFYVFVTLVVAFFLAVEPGVVLREVGRLVPVEHRPRVARVARNIHERIGAWARGQILIAIIVGAVMAVGLRLLGVPYAWSLGAVAGILEVVPYVGGAVTVILASLSAATVGIPQVIGVIVLYIIIVNVESHILAPLLYGKALGLPPVAVLLALLAGVELLGILGALLAIPLTVIAWAIVEEFMPKIEHEPEPGPERATVRAP